MDSKLETPPDDFIHWWWKQEDASQGVNARKAWNCKIYRDAFLEAKALGIVTETFDQKIF